MVEETTLSAEENAARMDEMMAGEEAAQSALAEEMRRLRDVQFKKTQELHNVRTEEKNCMAEIQVRRLVVMMVERYRYGGWDTGMEAGIQVRRLVVVMVERYRYGGWWW